MSVSVGVYGCVWPLRLLGLQLLKPHNHHYYLPALLRISESTGPRRQPHSARTLRVDAEYR